MGALLYVGVEDAFLLQVVGHGVLGEERRLETDFGADPFAFGVGDIRFVVAAASAAELRAEVSRLDLLERADVFPGLVTYSARHVNF